VHAAVTACLGFEAGRGGDKYWTTGKKEHQPSFDAKSSIGLDDKSLGTALIPIDRTNDDDVRVLRALAWVNEKGPWAAIPNGDVLQRLCMEKVQIWAQRVSISLALHEQKVDAELVRLTHTLLAVSKALGIDHAYKSDALSRTKAIFEVPPEVGDTSVRPQLRRWQDRFIGTELKPERHLLQQRLLRLASYSQGGGAPLALDLPRLLRAVRGNSDKTPWPAHVPDVITEFGDKVERRIAALDPLLTEALTLVPDPSDLDEEITQVAKALNKLVAERSHAGDLPASIDGSSLANAAKAVKPGDLKKVNSIGEALRDWGTLTADERLHLLTSDWEGPAVRIQAWLTLALPAVAALEEKLKVGTVSDTQREYEDVLERLGAGLETLSHEAMRVAEPEESACD
jgi:hypothetical protein